MGQARQTAEAVITAFQSYNPYQVRDLFADDFMFDDPSSPMPPAGPDEWLKMQEAMANAFSDLDYNFDILREDGNRVWVASEIMGTHDGPFDLSAMGMGSVAPTGKSVSAGRSVTMGTLNDKGKIQSIEVVEQEGAGVPGILQQIGVDFG